MAVGQNGTIAKMTAQGYSLRDIERATGVSKSTVHRKLHKSQVIALVNKANEVMAKSVVKGALKLVKISHDDNHKDQVKAIGMIQANMGLSPTHAPTQFQVNIYNDNRQQTIAPGVMEALGPALARITGQIDDDGSSVIDIE